MTDQRRVTAKPWIWIAGASFCVSALLDLFYFPPGLMFPDEGRFVRSAVQLAQSGGYFVASDRAWEMPGTAVFFSVFIAIFGQVETAILPIRLVQAVLVALQAFLIGITAQRIFGNRLTGVIAMLMTAFYPFLFFYQGLLLSETLFNTFLIAGFASLYWWRERGMHLDKAFVIICLSFGSATMTKATLSILPPILLASATLGARDLRLTLRTLIAAALIHVSLLSPWWIRNAIQLQAFVPLTTGAAENLYLGNNPNNPRVGIDWTNDVERDVVYRLKGMPNELERERERAFMARAVQYIRDYPSEFAHRAYLKFLRFWNIVPNAVKFRGSLYALISAVTFGPVLLLSISTAFLWWRLFPVLLPIYLLIGYFTAVHIVMIASLRYRLPLEPFLILLAAGSLGAVFTRYLSRAKMDATFNPTTAV